MKNGRFRCFLCGILSSFLIFAVVLSIATPSFAWFVRAICRQLTNDGFSASSLVSYFAGGTGTESDPYKITQPKHLYNLAWLQNSGVFDETTHFILENDIDMAGSISGQETTGGAIPPIGTNENPFTGHFLGNGCVISNLWVSTDISDWKERPEGVTGYSSTHVGLFGAISGTATIENFNLDRVEIKSHIDATVGIICGYVDTNISGIGVYNGILNIGSGVTCRSEYSLLGEISDSVIWADKPSIATGEGEGEEGSSGGELVIKPSDFGSVSLADGSFQKVEGALEGTAYYVGHIVSAAVGGPTPNIYDMRNYTSGTPPLFEADSAANNYQSQLKVIEAYNEYKTSQKYLYSSGVPSASNTVSVTIGEKNIQIPKNGVWFKPVSSGVAALAFAKTNNNADKYMAIYKYQRDASGNLQQIAKQTFLLPKSSLKNGSIVYYEYEITREDVQAGYEYVIGAADTGSAGGNAGFIAIALAGTDESSGEDPGGGGGSGDTPGTKKILNVDYVVNTAVDVSADTYQIHQTLLQIASDTTTVQGIVYYKATGTEGSSTVYYYMPSMGLTLSDISKSKQSAAATDTTMFETREETAP